MGNKRKLCSLTLVSAATILLLIIVSSIASATAEQGDQLTETRITSSGYADISNIYCNTIVWYDYRNGNHDIYMYNLSTSKETQITNNESDQMYPKIYENNMIWKNYRSEEASDIYVQNLSTKTQTRITTSREAWAYDIYGNRIIYGKIAYNERESWHELYMYDLSTKKETQIPIMRSSIGAAIYGNRIVWLDFDSFNGGDYYIYMYDLSTKKLTQITKGGWGKEEIGVPDIYDDKIVYEADRNGNYDIYMYDLSTSKETQITTNKSNQQAPAIYGNTIVWQDNRNGNWDIYAYDLVTRQQIYTINKSDQTNPSIYGDKVVWTDSRNEKTDIYMGTISCLPVASFTASPTSGKAPLTVAFTDKSTGSPTKWKWNFGDGKTSTQQNPTHKYSKVGSYTVSLTATNDEGSNTVTKKDYIVVTAATPKPIAAFSASPTSGKAPLTVAFADKSTGTPTKWKWSFGDGASSIEKNPKHEYLQEGNYKVTLTVTNAAGSSTATKTNYIKVTTNTRPGIYTESK